MSITKTMEAYYKDQSYSAKTGSVRKPQQVFPATHYDVNRAAVTDKELELYLIQHKQMNEFLSKKGLIEEFNQFQKKKAIQAGEYADWFKKWN